MNFSSYKASFLADALLLIGYADELADFVVYESPNI